MNFARVRDVKKPSRAHEWDAGVDFFIPDDTEWETYTIQPGCHVIIPSGVKVDVPPGYAFVAFEKSGVATRTGLIAGARVVDPGYQGEIHFHLINPTHQPVTIKRGDKILQFLLLPAPAVRMVEKFPENLYGLPSERGEGKFGSTGS